MLIAPLNWGLGHATRCIPLIKALMANGCEVVLAASGNTVPLLRQEFLNLELLEIKGYQISYAKHKYWLPFHLLLQLPGVVRTIYREHQWLKKAVSEHNIDAVISDNRFGLYHKKLPCVYITHQLHIATGNRFTDWVAQKIHYRFINKYTECWVPDAEQSPNLAGLLSHPKQLPSTPVTYLGALSRLEKTTTPTKTYDILLLLSGPEPQRTMFEDLLLAQLKSEQQPHKILLVRGLPGESSSLPEVPAHVQVVNYLPSDVLGKAIQQSDWIICRSGYTTVMDLVHLGKRAILVPTPGQTEQVYLGRYLQTQGLFYCVQQDKLNLATDIEKAAAFNYATVNMPSSVLADIVAKWVGGLTPPQL